MLQNPKTPRRIGRGFSLTLIAIVALGLVAYFLKQSKNSPLPRSEESDVHTEVTQSAESEPQEISPAQFLSDSSPGIRIATSRSIGTNPAPDVLHSQPTPYSRQLVGSLTNLDFSVPISRERVDQWKNSISELVHQGQSAVPAIREFLQQNQDIAFGTSRELFGYSSLRSALLASLEQIGGSESTDAMLEVLQTSNLPSEISQVAHELDRMAPGQYSQQTVQAVEDVLALSEKGQLAGTDVGPLFKTLSDLGSAGTGTLEKLETQWKYYSTLALASNPAGLPPLLRETQDTSANSRQDLAFQMLAQAAANNPEAAAALVDAARKNRIPAQAWRKIVTGLLGDQYLLMPTEPIDSMFASAPGLKTYHIESGNQNFYSLPASNLASSDQLASRRSLAQQLMSVIADPAVGEVLRSALASLPPTP